MVSVLDGIWSVLKGSWRVAGWSPCTFSATSRWVLKRWVPPYQPHMALSTRTTRL